MKSKFASRLALVPLFLIAVLSAGCSDESAADPKAMDARNQQRQSQPSGVPAEPGATK